MYNSVMVRMKRFVVLMIISLWMVPAILGMGVALHLIVHHQDHHHHHPDYVHPAPVFAMSLVHGHVHTNDAGDHDHPAQITPLNPVPTVRISMVVVECVPIKYRLWETEVRNIILEAGHQAACDLPPPDPSLSGIFLL